MKIQVDEEGKKMIQSLCGVAVESVGGRVLGLVNLVLSNLRDVPPQKEITPEKPAEAEQ